MADNLYLGIAEKYGQQIKTAAKYTGLDPNVILSVLMTESAGDTTATSRTGARGLMQLMPGTAVEVAKSLGYDKYKDEADLMQQLHSKPGLNILFGSKYFKDVLDKSGGDVARAYVGYHDGPESETFATGQGFGPELSLGLDSLSTHLNNLGYGKPKAAPALPSQAAAPAAAPIVSTPAAPEKPGLGDQIKMAFESLAQYVPGGYGYDPREKLTTGTTSPEQYGKGFVEGVSFRRATLPGVPAPTNPTQQVFGGVGQGSGMAVAMMPVGRGVGAATAGVGNATLRGLLTGAGSFGAYEAAAPAENFKEWSTNTLKGIGMGTVASAAPMLPVVRNIARIPYAGRPAVDLATFTGMGMAEGQTAGEAALSAVPMMIGAGAVHAAGGEAVKSKKARIEEAARKVAEAEMAQEAQNALPVPVTAPYSGRAADYGPTVRAAQAWSEALPPTQELYDQMRRPVTTRRALPPVATEGGVPADPRVLPAETKPPTLAVDPAEIRQMADDVMAEAVASGNPRMAGVADRLQQAAQRAADEIPRRELVPPETIPARWDASTPEQIPPGTLVEPRGNPMPTTAEPAPIGAKPALVDQYGRPVSNRRRGSRAAADVPVNWSPSPDPIPDPTPKSRIVAPGQRRGRGDLSTFDIFGATVEGGKLAGELGKKAGGAISDRARRAKANSAEREAAAIRAEADRIKAEMRRGGAAPAAPGGKPAAAGPVITAHSADKTAQVLADHASGKITDQQLTAKLQEVGVSPTPEVQQQLDANGIGKVGGWSQMGGLDRRRALRQMTTTETGGSQFNDPITKNTLRLWELAERSMDVLQTNLSNKMVDILTTHGISRRSKMNGDLSRISEAATDTGLHPLELLEPTPKDATPAEAAYRNKVREIAKNSEDWGRLITAFDAVQAEYRKMGKMRNEIHRAVGAEPFDMRKYYSPRIERKYSFTGKGQEGLKAKYEESRRAFEQFTRPAPKTRRGIGTDTITDVWSAREQRRGEPMLDESRRSYDMYEQANSYIQDTARVVGNSVALKRSKLIVKQIRDLAAKYENPGTAEKPNPEYDLNKANEAHVAADALEAMANYGYAGKSYGIQGAVKKALNSTRPGVAVYKAEQAMTTAFNYSRYMGNIRFLTTTQWLAPLMAASQGRVTPDMLAAALKEAATPRLAKEWEASYTNYAKSKRQGNPLHEGRLDDFGLSTSLERAGRGLGRRGKDVAISVAEKPTAKIESITGRLTYAIAEQIALRAGPKLGWTPQDYLDFKSDTVGLTSQYFDKINRAPLLSTPLLKAAYPAQGFSFDAVNSIVFGAKGMSGAETVQSRGQRAEKVGATIAALVAGATLQSLVRSNKKDEDLVKEIALNSVTSAIPGAGNFLGLGDASGKPYQAQLVETMFTKVPEMLSKGENLRAAGTVAGEFVPGGQQIKRVTEANRALEKGIIKRSDLNAARLYGWETTSSGKAYLRKLDKSKNKRRRRGSAAAPR